MTEQPAQPRVPSYVLMSDGGPEMTFPMLLKHLHGNEYEFHFEVFTSEERLLELLPTRKWGGIIAYLWNVRWNIPPEDDTGHRIQRVLRRYRELHPETVLLPPRIRGLNGKSLLANVHNGVRSLKRIYLNHGIATIAMQGLDLPQC